MGGMIDRPECLFYGKWRGLSVAAPLILAKTSRGHAQVMRGKTAWPDENIATAIGLSSCAGA
jgi:hypothetical protein